MAIAVETFLPTITTLETAESLDALAGSWNALSAEVPFRSHEWLTNWWRHYGGSSRRLFVVALRDSAGQLIGLAPWYIERVPGSGRVVRFLGSGVVCSDYLSLLCLPGHEGEVARHLASWLTDAAARDWDQLEFSGVAHDDGALPSLIEHLAADGQLTDQRLDCHCWRTELPADWEGFLAGLSSSRRQRTRTLLRRSIDSGRVALREVENVEDLEYAFPLLIDLHQKRRRSLGQAGCFANRQFTDFHREVSRAMLAAGTLRMLWLELAGHPIAVEYGFVGGKTIYYYQGGFDPAAADDRPGWLCFGASLRRAIEQGYQAFDFLRGDESYKGSWRADSQPMLQYRVFGRGTSAQVRRAAWHTTQSARRFVRGCRAALASKVRTGGANPPRDGKNDRPE